MKLNESDERLTKTVLRQFKAELSYRTIKDGFFFGEGKKFLFYPFPGTREMEENYHSWWRSALVECF